jgi:hypothetical protein
VLKLTNEVVHVGPFAVKPFVVWAARVLGPGPLRLKMVKLAHELDDRQVRRAA